MVAGKPFDVMICNAGVMAALKGQTADGCETRFGTNHLGHFVLVNRIASLLQNGSRLVNLSSAGHRVSDVNLEDPNFEHTECRIEFFEDDIGRFRRPDRIERDFAV